eukprot:g207.t1
MLSVGKAKVQGFSARERKQRGRKAALMRRIAPSLGMEMASICCGLRDGYLLDLRCVDGDDLACILENVEIEHSAVSILRIFGSVFLIDKVSLRARLEVQSYRNVAIIDVTSDSPFVLKIVPDALQECMQCIATEMRQQQRCPVIASSLETSVAAIAATGWLLGYPVTYAGDGGYLSSTSLDLHSFTVAHPAVGGGTRWHSCWQYSVPSDCASCAHVRASVAAFLTVARKRCRALRLQPQFTHSSIPSGKHHIAL